MIDFGPRGILNGLSQEEVFALVQQTMDEVGIAYQHAPGGIIFHGLSRDDFLETMSITFDTIQSSKKIAYKKLSETKHVLRNCSLEQDIDPYRYFSEQSFFAA